MKKILLIMIMVFMAATSQAQTINKTQTDTTELSQRLQLVKDRQKQVKEQIKEQFRYFNLAGQEIYQDELENFNIYIVVTIFQDGRSNVVKVYNNCKEKYEKYK